MRASSRAAIRWSAPRWPIFRPAVAEELGIDDDRRLAWWCSMLRRTRRRRRLGVKRGDIVIGLNNDKVTSVAGS